MPSGFTRTVFLCEIDLDSSIANVIEMKIRSFTEFFAIGGRWLFGRPPEAKGNVSLFSVGYADLGRLRRRYLRVKCVLLD
jgi:hypothetical protein